MNVGNEVNRALDALEIAPEQLGVLESALGALQAGQAEACVDQLTTLGQSPGGPALYLLGLAHARLGDLYRAAAAFEAAIGAHPRLHRAYISLARIYEQQRDATRTAGVLRRALQLQPDDPHAIAALARTYNTIERPRRAETLARRGLELCPDSPVLQKALANALRRQDRHQEAVLLLTKVVAVDADAASLVALGRAHLATQQHAAAQPCFEQVLRHDSESMGALAGMAEALEANGQLSEARGYVLRALAAAPDLPQMYVLSARIHLADNRADVSERAALMALRIAPDNDEAAQLAIQSARARLRWAEAADYAEPLLARQPGHAESLAAVFIHQLLEGATPAVVLMQLDKHLSQNQDAADLHLVAGVAQLIADDTEAAVASLSQVIRLRDNHPLAPALLGVAYDPRRTGDARGLAVRAVLRTGDPSGKSKPTSAPLPSLSVAPAVNELLGDSTPTPAPTRLHERPRTGGVPPAAPEPQRLEALPGTGPASIDHLEHLRSVLTSGHIGARSVPLSDLVARLDHLLEARDNPITVALLGPAGAGRTTLLNALAGRPLLPTQSKVPHVLRYGRTALGRIVYRTGEIETLGLTALGPALDPPPDPAEIRRIELLAPVQELTRVHLIDYPTGQSTAPDAVIWVISADQPMSAWDDAVCWLENTPVAALAVISRADLLPTAELLQRIAAVRNRLGERVADVVGFSAHAGLEALAQKDVPALRRSGFPKLSRLLRRIIVDQADAIRAHAITRRARHIRCEALERTDAWLQALETRAAAVGVLAGRLAVDRARLHHEAQDDLPERFGRALQAAITARAAERTSLRGAELSHRAHLLEAFRGRLSRACTNAVDHICAELDTSLNTLLSSYFETLERVFPADGDATESARLGGLRAVLDGYRALLLEERFGRHAAFLQGWIAKAPLERWITAHERQDPVHSLFSIGLGFELLPPLELSGLGAALFDGLARFVDTTAADLRVAQVKLSQRLVEPLQRFDQSHLCP
jgi:tetratricopeptide (TPR) repeat protein